MTTGSESSNMKQDMIGVMLIGLIAEIIIIGKSIGLETLGAKPENRAVACSTRRMTSGNGRKDTTMVKDHIQRGDYTYKIAPRIIFSAIRLADLLVGILLLLFFVEKFSKLSDVLENGPAVIFLTCVLLAALKQIYWAWILSRERFTWFMALFPWNNILDWIWIFFLSKALNSNVQINVWIYTGAIFFLTGSLIEFTSDLQLHRFKRDTKNQGKLYTIPSPVKAKSRVP